MRLLAAIIAWSLSHRPWVLLGALLLVLLGLRAGLDLTIDAVPDVTGVQVQVITSAPALAPLEIEEQVSIPIERVMAGLPAVESIRSVSKYGISVVTVFFAADTDLFFARQVISERMAEARAAVPEGSGAPALGPISTGLGEIYQFYLRSETHSAMELEELLRWTIGPQLRSVPGIVEVNAFGGERRQVEVRVVGERLQALGIGLDEVAAAVRGANRSAGGGYLDDHDELLVIGLDGLARDLDDLRAAVIKTTQEGIPITVGDLAEVTYAGQLRRGAATAEGEGEVVVGLALMLAGANARTVTAAVKERLEALLPSLPQGVEVVPFYDRSVLVDRTIRTVAINLLEGAALVILVLFLLLGDLRAGLVVALTIPLAMLFALIVMHAVGLSGNLMSLGAIDFGLIVDGAVIVVENASRRLSEARRTHARPLSDGERRAVVEAAALEVRKATVYGEAIVAIVYLPILMLRGIEGALFIPMALTVLLALAGAFVLSLTLIPVLTSYLVRPGPEARETALLRLAQRLYRPTLAWALAWRRWVIMAALLGFAGALALFPRLGAIFVPQLDEGDLLVEVQRLPGTAMSSVVATSLRIERALLPIPEVTGIVTRIGSPEVATDSMSIEQSDAYIQLSPREAWRIGVDKEALATEIIARIEAAVPEVAASISQPIEMRTNELVAGIRADVGVIIYGPDLGELRDLGDQVLRRLRDIPGLVDLRGERIDGLRYLRITPDRDRLARVGLRITDLAQVTEALAVGHPLGEQWRGARRYGIVLRLDHGFDGELEALRTIPLRTPRGDLIPLGDVATLSLVPGPALINREEQSRRRIIEFNVRGRDLVSTVADAQQALAGIELPVGYRIDYGGTFEHYEQAKARLLLVIPLALGLILFLLWAALSEGEESPRSPPGGLRAAVIIFLNVPFAVIGGVLILGIRGLPFSISAGVGFIALFGIAVLNGLVLVTFARRLESDHGLGPAAAIRQAAELRLRPVLMTATTTALGFIPMALSTAPGSEVQRPLASVVIGGVLSASLLTLLVLPAVYATFGRRSAGPPP